MFLRLLQILQLKLIIPDGLSQKLEDPLLMEEEWIRTKPMIPDLPLEDKYIQRTLHQVFVILEVLAGIILID